MWLLSPGAASQPAAQQGLEHSIVKFQPLSNTQTLRIEAQIGIAAFLRLAEPQAASF